MKITVIQHNGYRVEVWYDRPFRCWFAIRTDKAGNQKGHSIDAHAKAEIFELVRRGFLDGI